MISLAIIVSSYQSLVGINMLGAPYNIIEPCVVYVGEKLRTFFVIFRGFSGIQQAFEGVDHFAMGKQRYCEQFFNQLPNLTPLLLVLPNEP